ncbi:MAG TPA: hypothetical protein PLX84_14725 [Acidiphilium sp.]|nr:hypothetical protein [Acidiphilium sp.]
MDFAGSETRAAAAFAGDLWQGRTPDVCSLLIVSRNTTISGRKAPLSSRAGRRRSHCSKMQQS